MVSQRGICIEVRVYQDNLCLCKLKKVKGRDSKKNSIPRYVPVANAEKSGPLTFDFDHLSPQSFSLRLKITLRAMFGVTTFSLPWLLLSADIKPKSSGSVSLRVKGSGIQKKSMVETMFSLVLPLQHFRKLFLKYFDCQLNLNKRFLSRNPVKGNTQTHQISEEEKDRYLFSVDALFKLPVIPKCLIKHLSEMMIGS